MIGLISDTHGLVRPEALRALAGCDLIIHAGDIGSPKVLAALRELAPVRAVRGNNDRDAWASDLAEVEVVHIAGVRLLVGHDVRALDVQRAPGPCAAVIAGHSHRPAIEERSGTLYVNPGSAGPRRFSLPVAVGKLYIAGRGVRAELIRLA